MSAGFAPAPTLLEASLPLGLMNTTCLRWLDEFRKRAVYRAMRVVSKSVVVLVGLLAVHSATSTGQQLLPPNYDTDPRLQKLKSFFQDLRIPRHLAGGGLSGGGGPSRPGLAPVAEHLDRRVRRRQGLHEQQHSGMGFVPDELPLGRGRHRSGRSPVSPSPRSTGIRTWTKN